MQQIPNEEVTTELPSAVALKTDVPLTAYDNPDAKLKAPVVSVPNWTPPEENENVWLLSLIFTYV